MNIEERKVWATYFEQLDESRRNEIDLEKRIVEEERERIRKEIEGN